MNSSNALQKYLAKPFPGSSHSWAFQQLRALPSHTRVLDIGPGSCLMGEALREQGLTELFAIEIDAAARERAAAIYSRVEESLAPFEGEYFDVMLMLDVLEHMNDPFGFLAQAACLLRKGGRALISVPNVAHWSVRLPLIFGQFEYRERGILDRTHLQFFTRKRLKQLLHFPECFTVLELNATIPPLEFVLPAEMTSNAGFRLFSKMHHLLARTVPGFFAYQHLALIQKA